MNIKLEHRNGLLDAVSSTTETVDGDGRLLATTLRAARNRRVARRAFPVAWTLGLLGIVAGFFGWPIFDRDHPSGEAVSALSPPSAQVPDYLLKSRKTRSEVLVRSGRFRVERAETKRGTAEIVTSRFAPPNLERLDDAELFAVAGGSLVGIARPNSGGVVPLWRSLDIYRPQQAKFIQ